MAEVLQFNRQGKRVRAAQDGGGELPLVERMALLLAQLIEEPLLVLPSDVMPFPAADYQPTELKLSQFRPELAALAEALLEEAGF